MKVQYIFPLSDLEVELRPLFSNGYMLSFFKKFYGAIQSRMWRFTRGRNVRLELITFLESYFIPKLPEGL